ncbi:MAG TPA: hypothetical protein VNK46_01280 [Nitrospiraceae bacterium]|jgi:DNA repair exonuclease SbcCD ATPase subunit|nr:hypothetical protein [Nitrospiraceae bacterium]
MEQDGPLSEYRQRLLDALKSRSTQRRREEPDLLQVFVNQERVGTVACAATKPTFAFASRERIVHSVEIRTEDGALIGGLCAPEFGLRTARVPLLHDAIEITVHNRMDGGSVRVTYKAAPALWHRVQQAAVSLVSGVSGAGPREPAWPRVLVLTQVALVAAVVALWTDRMTGWLKPEPLVMPASQVSALVSATQAQVDRLRQDVARLADTQTDASQAVQSQRQELEQLQRTLAAVADTQQKLNDSVLTVQQNLGDRNKAVSREVEHLTRLLLSRADLEREQLRHELRTLTAANEALSKQMATLEHSNQELRNRLKSAGVDVSKAVPASGETPALAGTPKDSAASTQIAEARPDPQAQPFTFWVTFQEGTSEESIQHLIDEIHGRKGSVNAGWYPVEVPRPVGPPDRFLESIRQAKIVKAVSMSRVAAPGQ